MLNALGCLLRRSGRKQVAISERGDIEAGTLWRRGRYLRAWTTDSTDVQRTYLRRTTEDVMMLPESKDGHESALNARFQEVQQRARLAASRDVEHPCYRFPVLVLDLASGDWFAKRVASVKEAQQPGKLVSQLLDDVDAIALVDHMNRPIIRALLREIRRAAINGATCVRAHHPASPQRLLDLVARDVPTLGDAPNPIFVSSPEEWLRFVPEWSDTEVRESLALRKHMTDEEIDAKVIGIRKAAAFRFVAIDAKDLRDEIERLLALPWPPLATAGFTDRRVLDNFAAWQLG